MQIIPAILTLLSIAYSTAAFANPVSLNSTSSTAYRLVVRDQAVQHIINIELESGRSTAIDFSASNEQIVFVNLADPSRAVWVSNFPIASGQATTLFVTPIEPLNFPGATKNAVTNLMVQTIDGSGSKNLYTFNLHHVSRAREVGVVIKPPGPLVSAIPLEQSRIIDEFTLLSLDTDAIERGLSIAIARGYTAPDDPVVEQTRQSIALLRIGQPPRTIPVSVLRSLQALGRFE